MSALYIVLPLAILVVAVAVGAFLWAAKRGQFDDLETPAIRAIHEDPAAKRDAKEPSDERDRPQGREGRPAPEDSPNPEEPPARD